MRKIALAVVVGAGLLGAPQAASAQTVFNDPAGRITFTAPRGWTVEQRSSATQTFVLLFNASSDCYVIGLPNSATANTSPSGIVRATTAQIAPNSWTALANSLAELFPGGMASVVSQSVDTSSGPWPIQRAQLSDGSRTAFGALTLRPGFDLIGFCAATSGGSAATFDPVLNSLAHPNDAVWQSQAAATPVPAAAPAAAAPAEPAAEEPEEADPARRGGVTRRRG